MVCTSLQIAWLIISSDLNNENLYVQISVQNTTKRTRVVLNTYGNPCWGQTKHFPVNVRRTKKHLDNLITVHLLANTSMTNSMGGNNNNSEDGIYHPYPQPPPPLLLVRCSYLLL